MGWKLWVAIFFVVVALGLGGGAIYYYLNPPTDKTATNWNFYYFVGGAVLALLIAIGLFIWNIL